MENMNIEEFLKELFKEGLLIYGTTWLENFKRLKELKKYKEMWGEFKKHCKKGELYINTYAPCGLEAGFSVKDEMDEFEQKYFPAIETLVKAKIEVNQLIKDVTDFHEKLLKKYFPTEGD